MVLAAGHVQGLRAIQPLVLLSIGYSQTNTTFWQLLQNLLSLPLFQILKVEGILDKVKLSQILTIFHTACISIAIFVDRR